MKELSFMKKNREAFIRAMQYNKQHHPDIWARTIELAPEAFWDALREVRVPAEMIKELKRSGNNISKLQDYRDVEQMKFNHFIGYAFECLAIATLEANGFKVERAGCEQNIMDATNQIGGDADLIVTTANGLQMRVDVQKTQFLTYHQYRLKKSKIKNLTRNGEVVILALDVDKFGRLHTSSTLIRNIQHAEQISKSTDFSEIKTRLDMKLSNVRMYA